MIRLRNILFPSRQRGERSAKERLGHRINGCKPGAAQSESICISIRMASWADEGRYREYEAPKAEVERDEKGGNASEGMISRILV